ncbi:MAG: hypothetical protein MJZ50_07545 [Treponema sp.]|nr:hypothetical protein [Treponema sp.]
MKEVRIFFRDDVDSGLIHKCCLHALKNGAVAFQSENVLLIDGSITDSEKEILVSEARAAGKTILINENEGDDDEEDLLH